MSFPWVDTIQRDDTGHDSYLLCPKKPAFLSKLARNQQSLRFPLLRNPRDIEALNLSLQGLEKLESWNIPDTIDLSLKAECYRLKHLLIYYRDNVQKKFQSVGEILHRTINEGPTYAAELSETLKYSQRRTFSKILDDKYLDYPELEDQIDYVFDPKCLLKWDNIDEEDYKLLFKPRKPVDQSIIDDVVNELEIVCLGKKLRRLDILDYTKWFSKSKIVNSFNTGKTIAKFEYHSTNDITFTNRLKFKRALVWKAPGESRDCLVCDGPTLHTVSRTSMYLSQIGRWFEEYKMHRDFDPYVSLRRLKNKNFLMVDLKKCGLTFPRNLFIPVLKKLEELFPNIGFKETYEGYDAGPTLLVKDLYSQTTEGVGLGMLNELVTIVMCLVWRVAKQRSVLPKCKGWFFNDDQLIYWKKGKTSFPEYRLEEWIHFLKEAGYTVHEKKPFYSDYGQFCEQWSQTSLNMEKCVRQYHILLSCCLANNIYCAKQMFSQQYFKWWGLTTQDNELALTRAIEWWGYEFSPDEIELPFELGGWIYFREKGLNQSLLYLTRKDCPSYAKKLWYFYKEPQLKYKPWKKNPKSIKFFQQMQEFEERGHSIFSFKKKMEKLEQRCCLVSSGVDYIDSYNLRYNKMVMAARKATQKQNNLSYPKLVEKINSEEFNNYCIPLCSVQIGDDIHIGHTPKAFEITPCADLERLWLALFSDVPVSAPETGDLTSFLSLLNIKSSKLPNDLNYVEIIERLNLVNLTRFGLRTKDLLIELFGRLPRIDISIIGKGSSLFNQIFEEALGEGCVLHASQGIVWKTKDFQSTHSDNKDLLFENLLDHNHNIDYAHSQNTIKETLLLFSKTFELRLIQKQYWVKAPERPIIQIEVLKDPDKSIITSDPELLSYIEYQVMGVLNQIGETLDVKLRHEYRDETLSLSYLDPDNPLDDSGEDLAGFDMFGDD